MAIYRKNPPQLGEEIFLTDSGMETDLVFNKGFDLPYFGAFMLLKDPKGRAAIRDYCLEHALLAKRRGLGFIFESATWRASPDWGDKLGLDRAALEAANRDAIALVEEVRDEAALETPFVISGNLGPRGDGYQPGSLMTAKEAEDYHSFQAEILADTAADLVTALTMNNAPEAIGVANAAAAAGMPCAISFTVETDGRLPSGQPLGEAIMETDFEARKAPAYYMINCAHPAHFTSVLREGGAWTPRLRGLRANASKCSHAELDEAETLDDGNPGELGLENAALRRLVPSLTIFGGCCGTDLRHVAAIAAELGRMEKAA
ncbi:homocysteine S-methyltransferase family protein [Hyphococcus luteus]|uniref:Homocysteine S-methyltransferase n=1 Tax=Hyphococcus luteus TaxID=2058213 RepID=A0A2S7K9L3_9PROT|nr:homocysteine S-methyltransferase family protein [Marinicaulis flavus]PQA89182.1 homocysteine S-methyltransferase [Marinicaulis flavus]